MQTFRTSSFSWNNGACAEVGWRKSSYSAGDECTEVGWRKSSHSNSQGACTEVASRGVILVRDTMDRGGFTLEVSPDTWTEFLSRVRRAEPFPA